jgi:hypothetical protein
MEVDILDVGPLLLRLHFPLRLQRRGVGKAWMPKIWPLRIFSLTGGPELAKVPASMWQI